MGNGEKAEYEEAGSSVPNLKKKPRGKRIQRKDNRREKQNIDLSVFFFAFFFSIALVLFCCKCLTKAVFCHLLYFIPPVSVPGYLLLFGGQWECRLALSRSLSCSAPHVDLSSNK